MRVKICGLTRYQDCELALSLGATELGLIFAKSPRSISTASAKEILGKLPSPTRSIGVFQEAAFSDISKVLSAVPLKGVQLHGQETPELVDELRQNFPSLFIIKVFSENQGSFDLDPTLYQNADAFLFDTTREARIRIPFSSAIPHTQKISFIAGGINPCNVKRIIQTHHARAIDVASGVESSPGIKDPKKLESLFHQLKDLL